MLNGKKINALKLKAWYSPEPQSTPCILVEL